MNDISIKEMMDLQIKLWEQHKDTWSPMEPEYGRNSLLWLVEELGEVIAIVKKKGESKIMNDEDIRNHFVEEMSDVMMYLLDAMLRFKVTPAEFATIYKAKSDRNMGREYNKEYQNND